MTVLEIILIAALALVLLAFFFSARDDDKIIRLLNQRVKESESRERQSRWDVNDTVRQLNLEADELRSLLAAVLNGQWEFADERAIRLSKKALRRATRGYKVRYQRDGNTGDVTLRLVNSDATENEGKFL